MRFRSTLLMLAVVLVTAVVAYLLTGKPSAPKGTPAAPGGQAALLPGFQPEAVQSVIVERPGQPRVVCRRQDDGWRLVEPVEARANADRINRILSRFKAAGMVATFPLPDPVAGAPYGLKEPRFSVALRNSTGAAGLQSIVRFGAPMPIGNLTYVAVAGRNVAVAVQSELAVDADVTAADLRSSVLVPGLDPLALQVLAISAGPLGNEPGFALECRRSGERWELTSPVEDLADADAVMKLAARIRDFRAEPADLITASLSDCGLDRPDLTVTLTAPAGTQALLLSHRPDGCYAVLQGETAPVRVPSDFFDALRTPPDDLRERALPNARPIDVARIELAGPTGDVTLVRQPGGWQIAGPSPAPADATIVAGMLDALSRTRAHSFPAEAPADRVRTVVTLRAADDHTLAELHLDRSPSSGDVFAARPAYHSVLLLERDERLDALFGGRLGLLARTLLQAPADEAAQVDLQNALGSFRAEWKDGWRLTAPVSGPADDKDIDAVLKDFADLHADAFAAEADADPAAFGLDKPQAAVTVSYRSPGAQALAAHTLRIGAAAPSGGAYADLDGDGRVFVVSDAVAGHLRPGLASKVICQVDALAGLTFRAHGRKAEFNYNTVREAWMDASKTPLRGSGAAAMRDLTAMLADWRARAVADYVEKSPALYGFDTPYLELDLAERTTSGKHIVVGKEAPGGGRYVMGPATGYVLIADDKDIARLRNALPAR